MGIDPFAKIVNRVKCQCDTEVISQEATYQQQRYQRSDENKERKPTPHNGTLTRVAIDTVLLNISHLR